MDWRVLASEIAVKAGRCIPIIASNGIIQLLASVPVLSGMSQAVVGNATH